MTLAPCTVCRRHIRLDEPSCPFCGGAVPTTLTAETATPRLSRSALAALGAIGVGLGLAGCPTPMATLYGGPPTPRPEPTTSTSASASESTSPAPTASEVAIYGAPPAP
ncbi:MAG: hypothetical protein JNL79_04320 [Myxococcales bacterium]|nr:hypothetical protein [Myxococcales bacterium]